MILREVINQQIRKSTIRRSLQRCVSASTRADFRERIIAMMRREDNALRKLHLGFKITLQVGFYWVYGYRVTMPMPPIPL